MRVRIASVVSGALREVERSTLEAWLNLSGKEFDKFVGQGGMCGWGIEGNKIVVPLNKENEAKGTVVRETVNFERELQTPLYLDSACAFFFF